MKYMLTIAILHYQQHELTDDCCFWIDRQELPAIPIRKFVLDNGSTIPYAGSWETVRITPNCGNIGGQNACFEQAEDGWVLFVANDVRLRLPGTILRLYGLAINLGEYCGQIQPLLLSPGFFDRPRVVRNARRWIDNGGLRWVWPGYGISRKFAGAGVHAVTSSCYMMRKKVWQDIGGFDESFISSHEDIDMGIRLRRAGYQLLCDAFNAVEHLGNATLKHTLSNHRRHFHEARLHVIDKHYHGLDRWFRRTAVQLIDGVHSAVQSSVAIPQ